MKLSFRAQSRNPVLDFLLKLSSRKYPEKCYNSSVQKKAVKFRAFAEAEKADREFYRKLSGQERLDILLEMAKEATKGRIERVYRVVKLPRR